MSTTPRPLPRSFYNRETVTVTREILGNLLIRKTPEEPLIGRIVEAEAYRGADDPASHSYRGKTRRNEVMFGKPGVTYVYFTYGNHYCLNISTEEEGVPAAILIRALEPLEGIEAMKRNRGVDDLLNLTSGPGKLTKALRITREDNGVDVTDRSSDIVICEPREAAELEIVQTTRIGIRVARERPWRFYIRGNSYVSKG